MTNSWAWAADFPSWYQIWCKNVDRKMLIDAQVMAQKTKFKMAAAAILNLLPVATQRAK